MCRRLVAELHPRVAIDQVSLDELRGATKYPLAPSWWRIAAQQRTSGHRSLEGAEWCSRCNDSVNTASGVVPLTLQETQTLKLEVLQQGQAIFTGYLTIPLLRTYQLPLPKAVFFSVSYAAKRSRPSVSESVRPLRSCLDHIKSVATGKTGN